MKRLLAALLISFSLHALILFSDPALSDKQKKKLQLPRHLTVALSYRQPQAPPIRRDPKVIRSPEKKRDSAPHAKKSPQPKAFKTPPQKQEAAVQEAPIHAPVPKSIPAPIPALDHLKIEPLEPIFEPSPTDAEEGIGAPSKAATESSTEDHSAATPSVPVILREARPAYQKNPPPPYPGSAKRRGIEGSVLLEVFVDSRGKVDGVKIFKSSGYTVLDRAALAAVRTWVFEPGTVGERPVGMWVRIPIRFELK